MRLDFECSGIWLSERFQDRAITAIPSCGNARNNLTINSLSMTAEIPLVEAARGRV